MNYESTLAAPQSNKSLLIIAGVVLLAFASQLSIPLQPVPLTFQSATVILIGMACGPTLGSYIVGAYLLAGACGLPVFADFNAGPTVFFGPTGGYLLGFLPAAFLSGFLAKQRWARSLMGSFTAACLGAVVIFTFGLIQLSTFIGWENAITLGLMPFILSETIKLIAVAFVARRCWKQVQ